MILSSLLRLPMYIISRTSCPVLLYHSTYTKTPPEIQKGLHNIDPSTLLKQVTLLHQFYRFVFVDEIFSSKNIKGLCALTFDDGYSCLDEVIPHLVKMHIPFTIYLNSSRFDGKIFWRDKIRILINNNLVDDFITQTNLPFSKDEFHNQTKSPTINSHLIDMELDRYFLNINMQLTNSQYCYDSSTLLSQHNLISYGNHTHSHYMLSSLTPKEQCNEITQCHNFLKALKYKSSIFSAPFGNSYSINDDTIQTLSNLNYKGFLLTENFINFSLNSDHKLPFLYRILPSYENISITLLKVFIISVLYKFFPKKF